MSWAHRLMYAVGFAPWDRGIPVELHALVAGASAVSTAVTADKLRRRFAGWDLAFEGRHSGAATAAMRRAEATPYRLRRAAPEALS